jgi:FlaA1/EpsC-like NDP-sugar epimerase
MPIPESHGWGRFLPGPCEDIESPHASGHAGQSVLVTGAGGFIGSALVHAIARAGPACIVLLDSSEHNLFEIDRDVELAFARVPRAAILGSVEDGNLLDDVFRRFHPQMVYHAAAFKHVPLLEINPIAAVRNNAIGTYNLAQTAIRHGASRLVLISTDKAVNPHSVMGVSKRIAELAIVAMSSPACRMSATRLGNVIGSPGSVVPAFLKQISERRPVTVTHPQASRWFLALRETIEAVIACGNAACGTAACDGRILLPELGEPVQIAELAAFLVRAAGPASAAEIPIVFTGLRPGDKLTEESVFLNETRDGFAGPLEVIRTRRLSLAELDDYIEQLSQRIAGRDASGLIRTLCSIVPEYVPSGLLR